MIILDCIIAIMLMVSIIYSWQLNKKIVAFRNSREEFAKLVKILDGAIVRAEIGIEDLKILSSRTAADLNNKIEKAQFLADDLSFMTDRAGSLAEKLDVAISEARKYEKLDLSQNYRSQLEPQQNNPVTQMSQLASKVSATVEQPLDSQVQNKLAIESLLARISAANKTGKQDKVNA